ncbi:MAG: hypothetical protein EBR40_08470 [Proteobacteria bacterium]|nr:hypothetical protein [Pseudomonadota bacterium]
MKVDLRPYTEWEDWRAGMYRDVPREDEKRLTTAAASLLCDPNRLAAAMRDVTSEWKIASETNLHEPPNNRAWLGQAACAFAEKVPEHLTRAAWGMITDAERLQANRIADRVIDEWKYRTRRNPQLELAFYDDSHP